jgi:thymidylate kinase
MTAGRPFCVLLGPDGAGKSSVMRHLAELLPEWRLVSTDSAFIAPEHTLITRLRRDLQDHLLPGLGTAYSADFLASVLQTAVVHLRDQVHGRDPQVPVLVDSYYYKILAKCRMAGIQDTPMYDWWRTFPRPDRVVYLDVPPSAAWRRRGGGAGLNSLEYDGDDGDLAGFERYQTDLRKLMLEEVRDLPVTELPQQPSVERAAEAVREVLTS